MRLIKLSFLLIMLTFLSITVSDAQILNIEQQRIVTDTTGWAGRMGLSVSASKFTKSLFSINTRGHLQYKTNKDLYLLIANFDLVNADGENFDNRGYGHFRYNRKFTDLIRFEIFTQVQYNSLTKIKSRSLSGIGPRFKLSQHENAKFYWGLAYMYEYEVIAEQEQVNNDHRGSTYFTFTLLPVKDITFSNTTYIQPLLTDIQDYRVSNDSNLDFKINENLKFNTIFSFLYDEEPPADVPKLNYLVRNGLSYQF